MRGATEWAGGCIQIPSDMENREHPIPIAERVKLSCGSVFSCGPAVNSDPNHPFLRSSPARRSSHGGAGSGFVRQPGVPYLPDGPVNQRSHSAGYVLCRVGQRSVRRRPAHAPQARPLFFPAVHSSPSARPGLNPFPNLLHSLGRSHL
jgi:hypothetical protein